MARVALSPKNVPALHSCQEFFLHSQVQYSKWQGVKVPGLLKEYALCNE
jgi:hypothetical protein